MAARQVVKSKSEMRRLAIQAPARLPYKDDADDDIDQPLFADDLEACPGDIDVFPAEAELAADAAVEAELEAEVKQKARNREPLYHAVVLTGMHAEVVSATTKYRFARTLEAFHPDQVLVMVKGKIIPKIVKPTLAL